nr:dTDP-glucose 4,6-dehydratase [Candidatus Magasanikbacteria bacterium]
VQGDIADYAAVQKVVKENNIDIIVNYAAETHVDRSIMDTEAFLRTAIFGVYNLLEVTRTNNLQKLIQVSTDEVFGSIEQGEFTEESSFAPNSPYAASKAGADLLCRSYFVTYQTPVVVTHSCNYYGSHQYPEKVIPLFITNLLEGKKVPLYGDGKNVREWIHTSDHCRAIDAVLHKAQPGSVYNIGTGQEYTNIDLTNLVLQKMNLGQEMIEPVKDRAGHDRRYAVDHTKITRELGWEPTVKFEDGILETINWYRDNEWWWKDIKTGTYRDYYQAQYKDR